MPLPDPDLSPNYFQTYKEIQKIEDSYRQRGIIPSQPGRMAFGGFANVDEDHQGNHVLVKLTFMFYKIYHRMGYSHLFVYFFTSKAIKF